MTNEIFIEKAKQIALADAGVKAADAKFIKAKADYDDGRKVFDIEFIAGSKEYEYEINASSGKIIEKDVEAVKTKPQAAKETTTSAAAEQKNDFIGVDSAKQKALSHAGLTAQMSASQRLSLTRMTASAFMKLNSSAANMNTNTK